MEIDEDGNWIEEDENEFNSDEEEEDDYYPFCNDDSCIHNKNGFCKATGNERYCD